MPPFPEGCFRRRPLVRRARGYAARAGGKAKLAPPSGSAPKIPLPFPLRQLDGGLERIVAGLFHHAQIRLAKTGGQERGADFVGQARELGIKNIEMRAGTREQISDRGEDLFRGKARNKILAPRPMRLHNLGRDKNLAPRAMPRQCPDQPGDPIGNPRMEGGITARGSLRSVEDQRGDAKKIRACGLGIGLKRRNRLHRFAVKIGGPRDNQFAERRFRQIETGNRIEKSGGDRIGPRIAIVSPVERVPPPLKPYFAKQRLGDDFSHAGGLKAESIERMNMRPELQRDKKAREPAVFVLAAEQSLAKGVVRIVWLRLPPAHQVAPAAKPASSRAWPPAPAPDPRSRRASRDRSASANK